MINRFDSHCHLPHDNSIDNVTGTRLVCGITEENWKAIARLRGDLVHGYGLHPWWAEERSEQWCERLTEHIRAAKDAGRNVVLGEIGLDKLRGPPLAEQEELFIAQLAVAKEYGLAVSVHCVRAFGSIEGILAGKKKRALPEVVVMHSWLGSVESTKVLLQRARCKVYFGVGPLCLKNEEKFESVLRCIPIDRILVESDSHDPTTSWNDIEATLSTLSHLLDVPITELAGITFRNAETAYGM